MTSESKTRRGPVRPHVTAEDLRRPTSSTEAAWRLVRIVAAVTNPVAAIVAVGAGIGLAAQKRIRPRWFVTAAAVVCGIAVVAGTVGPYGVVWVELSAAVATAIRSGAVGDLGPAVGATVATRWPAWLWAQLPFGVAVGGVFGAVWAARKWRRRPAWRDEHSRSQARLSDRRLARAVARAEPPTPTARTPWEQRTVTLGARVSDGRPWSATMRQLGEHCFIDGPAGEGKTTTMVALSNGVLAGSLPGEQPAPLLFLTMKPDAATSEAIARLAGAHGRRFWHVTETGSTGLRYNPLGGAANPFQVANAVVEAEAHAAGGGFTEPHHQRAAERALRLTARALDELHRADPARWVIDYPSLARLLRPARMTRYFGQLSAALVAEWRDYLLELDEEKDLNRSIAGLRQRIAAAAEGGARDLLAAVPNQPGLVLREALDAGDVVLFDLDADADSASAQLVGNLVLQDLRLTLSLLDGAGWHRDPGDPSVITRHCQIVLDEFGALGGTLVNSLLRRARSRGGAVCLSVQEAGTLDEIGPTFKEVVITNTRLQLIHNQGINAEMYANLLGTQTVTIETKQILEDGSLLGLGNTYAAGQGNVRDGEAYVVHPNQLRRLRTGEVLARVRGANEPPAVIAVRRIVPSSAPVDAHHRPKTTTPPAGFVELGSADGAGGDGWQWDQEAPATTKARNVDGWQWDDMDDERKDGTC